jgi:hypothetical protein
VKRRHPIIGYRAWAPQAEPLRLMGVVKAVEWDPGDVVATCKVPGAHKLGRSHSAPAIDCACGLHAYYTLEQVELDAGLPRGESLYGGLTPRPLRILGAVVGWGRMVMCVDGWRAEYARPVALAYEERSATLGRRIGGEYGVPVVARENLEQVALEYGERYISAGYAA